MSEKIRITGPKGDILLNALATFVATVNARKAAAAAEAQADIRLGVEDGGSVDSLFETNERNKAHPLAETVATKERKRRAKSPKMRVLTDGRILTPGDVSDEEIIEAFERFAESRGWHIRIGLRPWTVLNKTPEA